MEEVLYFRKKIIAKANCLSNRLNADTMQNDCKRSATKKTNKKDRIESVHEKCKPGKMNV
jgi:hypothetical protein